MAVKTLLIVYSYHHMNTDKIARTMAKVLDAVIKRPNDMKVNDLERYDLVGFGSGIYGAKHHRTLLKLADQLPQADGRKAFLFSTFGAPAIAANEKFIHDNHTQLRERLVKKGYVIVDEFACAGLNTNSFLKLFGGLNRGRPNDEDLENAREFAWKLTSDI